MKTQKINLKKYKSSWLRKFFCWLGYHDNEEAHLEIRPAVRHRDKRRVYNVYSTDKCPYCNHLSERRLIDKGLTQRETQKKYGFSYHHCDTKAHINN